jgi:DNA-binding IclR family transcriptional regulator
MAEYFKVRLQRISSSNGDTVERLCEAVGVVSGRDRDKTVIQVFRTMIRHSGDKGIGGSELSELSGVNRITCLHHLKRLEEAGLVEGEKGRYHLRQENLRKTMKELRRETLSLFDMIEEMAREIDRELGD